MAKIRLTQQYIDNPPSCKPGKSREEHCDIALPGLYFETRATCTDWGTFFLRYKDEAGKTCHSKLGRSCDITLKEAREAAKKLRAEIQLGRNPQGEKHRQRESMDWDTFFDTHYYPHAKAHKRSHRNDLDLHRKWISPVLGKVRIDRITRYQIEQLHQYMADQGLAASTCNGLLRVIHRAYNLGMSWSFVDKNPAANIKLFHEDNKRQRILTPDELQRLTAILKSDSNRMVCNVILFLLSTGARLNEALKAEWKHIDREGRTWTIPVSNSKSRKVRRVPLNEAALRVLDDLHTKKKSPYLFINTKTGSRLTTISKVWDRIRQQSGMSDLRLHDLRHNFATMLVNNGVSIYEVKEILGHSQIEISLRYSRLAPETLQKASSKASDQIIAALTSAE